MTFALVFGEERMRLLAVITDLASAARFLRHRGEPTDPMETKQRKVGRPKAPTRTHQLPTAL